ncbi:tripartite tricarboxylate transporter substrate binding protein [Achromobacter sp. NFACC18-2]|uniref:tripartite tricarboxylate transporter substrate binding protein n=1 Tax=Achromobacter sp. NFACC18-2 TaxID=1564112 RepID=UPI0008AFE643|nr:tripartite tricarboxylate transporter substrate binding protein [Achromobacter sp. NFACC18-2]SEJ77680.1 Tripartite-type tricarboxylate transporter, receptor component TctC [Achromobacter sp. NFACC18-2]
MTPTRILAGCALALGALCAASTAAAAGYPDRPIRLIVPTSPGSTADVVARVVAENLGKALAQPLIVENLAGAAGIPGTRQLVSAKPDGYTLGIVSSNHAINPSLYKSLPYDTVRDITPISVIGTTPLVVVVGENSPYKTMGDLLKAAREQPGKINYGSSGTGSVLHLAGELLKSKAGVDMMHIPYKGGNALITDVMSGQIQVAFLATPSVLAQVQAGKLRALAVSTPGRLAVLPDVPTLDEAGVNGYSYDAWIALIGPAGLPADIVQKLQAATRQTMQSAPVLKALSPQGFVAQGTSASEAAQTLAAELTKSQALVKAAGVTIE